MKELVISSVAADDLREIADFISEHNPAAAAAMLRDINARFRTLTEQPDIGRARPEIEPDQRSFVVREHVIFYHVSGNDVMIDRVLHGSRDLDEQLKKGLLHHFLFTRPAR